MTDHPITPPPELVQQWVTESWHVQPRELRVAASDIHIATQAARWGADQELEACSEWIAHILDMPGSAICLREDRRLKPPSLKEQALAALDDAILRGDCITTSDALPIIRRALEQTND